MVVEYVEYSNISRRKKRVSGSVTPPVINIAAFGLPHFCSPFRANFFTLPSHHPSLSPSNPSSAPPRQRPLSPSSSHQGCRSAQTPPQARTILVTHVARAYVEMKRVILWLRARSHTCKGGENERKTSVPVRVILHSSFATKDLLLSWPTSDSTSSRTSTPTFSAPRSISYLLFQCQHIAR